MKRNRRLIVPLVLLPWVVVNGLGCGPPCKDAPPQDCLSEGNYLREDADPIPSRATTSTGVEYELLTASVDWKERDATDWVSVKVPGAGTLTVEYNWDNRKCKCEVVITDELGAKLDSAPNRGRRSSLAVRTDEGGLYFIRFATLTEGARSVYSAKFVWEREMVVAPPPPPPPDDPPPPPPPPPDTTKKKKKVKVDKVPDDAKLARIVKLVPGTDTDPSVITINRGSRDGISKGATGSIVGVAGARFKVKRVYGTTCEAMVKGVSPDKIRSASKAEFD